MNRFLCVLSALLLAALCLTGCEKKQEDAPEIPPGSVALHDGSVVPVADDSSQITETEDGYRWDFRSGEFSLTFPKDWESRFLIRGTTVYCLACFERANASSTLFSIEFRSAADVACKSPLPAMVLGVSGDEYACAVFPRRIDPSNGVLKMEFSDMLEDCGKILQTATAKNDSKILPLTFENYVPADGTLKSGLFGTWKLRTSKNGRLHETVIFDNASCAVTYNGEDGVRTGSCLYNIYAVTYDSTVQNSWGDAAIVFLDGFIYHATYYEGTPRTLEFSAAAQQPDRKDLLRGTVFEEKT